MQAAPRAVDAGAQRGPRALPSTRSAPLLAATVLALAPSFAAAQPLVVIDAGHGGGDPGAVGCSLEEADVVLDVALRLRPLLEAAGVRVALTRDDDTFVGLSARAAYANAMGADAFVSIHSNSNAGTPATGSETFVHPSSGMRTRELGRGIQDAILAAWMLTDRGLKEADFAVLRETSMPAALGELAFTNRCSPDAELLGDPAARQRMAEHQRDAVLRWLGIDPGSAPRTGTLRGVVFEDQGVGTEDTSLRLPGATVRIVETDASVLARDPDAAWSFELPAGTYGVEARHPGHATASRRCTVLPGSTTWCSVGLFRQAAPSDAGGTAESDAGRAPDASVQDAALADGRDTVGGCACSVGPRRPASRLLIAILLLALVASGRRLRGPWLVLLAAGCAHEPMAPGEQPGRDLGAATERGACSIRARTVASFVALGPEREWVAEGYASPMISPDGARVALASADYRALFVAELDTDAAGALRAVCRVGRCGWEPRWQGAHTIAYRVEGQSATAVPAEALMLENSTRTLARLGNRGLHAWTDEDDRAWLRQAGRTREIGPPGERIMMPSVAGDGRHVVMWSLTGGIVVHRVEDGATIRLGPGGHPRFDPGGRFVVFERTEDDGHAITASDLWIADLAEIPVVAPLLASPDAIERMPSLSAIEDGRGRLAYLRAGALVVRTVEIRR